MSLVDGRLKRTMLDSFQSFKSLSFVNLKGNMSQALLIFVI